MIVRRMCSAGGAAVGSEWSGKIAGAGRVVTAVTRVARFAACDEDSTLCFSQRRNRVRMRAENLAATYVF